MKTIQVNLYKFEELNEQAQRKALDHFQGVNVDCEWWKDLYEDARQIGLIIRGFSFDAKRMTAKRTEEFYQCAHLIKENHGENSATYKAAESFSKKWNELVAKFSDGINKDKVLYENANEFDVRADGLEKKFLKELKECYLDMLKKEYEHKISDEAIKETIESNEYDFLESGKFVSYYKGKFEY